MKEQVYTLIKGIQDGKHSKTDKERHEAGCPKGASPMRIFSLLEIDPKVLVSSLRELEAEGRIIVHNRDSIELSFEAI